MKHDVIVVGAGHNGLTSACYLARAGLDVLVVDASASIGGMTSTAPIISAAPQHQINLGALDATFVHATDLIQDLDLPRFGYREVWTDPIWVCLQNEDASIAIWRDARRTAEEIRKFSADDARAYLELTRTLDAMIGIGLPLMLAHPLHPGWHARAAAIASALKNCAQLRPIAALLGSSCVELISSRFRHPVVRGALASICSAFGPILADGTAVILLALGWYLRFGASRPIGGTQALPNALFGALRALGGKVRCNAAVDQIIVREGRAAGVRLHNGEELLASRAVLASCDPRKALLELLPVDTLSPEHQAQAASIPSFGDGTALLKVDVAMRGRLSLARYERRRGDGVDLRQTGIYMGTLDDAVSAETAAVRGDVPAVINLYAGIPTASDPSQAPEGQDTLWMYAHPMPLRPRIPWSQSAAQVGDRVIARAAEFIDGVAEMEIGRSVETSDDLARRFNATNGCLWHVDLKLTRLGPMRPARAFSGYGTPLPGYFLGSAGSHPVPGMSGLPGRLASQEILRKLRT